MFNCNEVLRQIKKRFFSDSNMNFIALRSRTDLRVKKIFHSRNYLDVTSNSVLSLKRYVAVSKENLTFELGMEKVNKGEWFIARKEKNNKPHLKAYYVT